MLLRTFLLALWPLISWGSTYDFDYRTVGDLDARPANVFDDGAKTYFQFAPGRPVPAILKVGPAGEQLTTWRTDGPYIVVDGVLPDWHLRQGRGIAAVRYAGSRPLGVKGMLYGAAVPIAETGPAEMGPVAAVAAPAHAQHPVPAPIVIAPPAPPSDVAASPDKAPALGYPAVNAPTAPAPEFSGSFVVQFLPAGTSALQPQGGIPTPAHAPARNAEVRRVSVKFAGGAVQASHADLARILTAAHSVATSAANADTIRVRAFSGAAGADTRKQYIALRLEKLKTALIGAGIPEAKIHFASDDSGRPASSRAVIEFVRGHDRSSPPRPLLTQAGDGAGRMVQASLSQSVGGMVTNRLAVGFNGTDADTRLSDRVMIGMALTESTACDYLIVRGYSNLADPTARQQDANSRARKAVAALVSAGIPQEKVRFAPVSLVPAASTPRADIVFIRNRPGVSV